MEKTAKLLTDETMFSRIAENSSQSLVEKGVLDEYGKKAYETGFKDAQRFLIDMLTNIMNESSESEWEIFLGDLSYELYVKEKNNV